jgi:transposase
MPSVPPTNDPAAPLVPDPRRPHLFRIPPQRPILALDVSKATLVTALDNRSGGKVRVQDCANTETAIRRLLRTTPPESCWILEPTGRYGNLAVELARAAGRVVLMADPRRAKAFLRSRPDRAKTDRVDSPGLGEYAATGALPLYPHWTPAMEETRQLLAARKGLSLSLARLRQQQEALPYAREMLEPAAQALHDQLTAIDRQLAAQVRTHPVELEAVARLDAIPGVGPVTATAATTCLESRKFGHPDQFVAYLGLDITVRESGPRKGKGEISSRGDAELRRLFYLAAQANLRSKHSPFRQQYDRERAKGLPHPGAVCAVARKLAKVCWALVKHGGKYEPGRVYTQPESLKSATKPKLEQDASSQSSLDIQP